MNAIKTLLITKLKTTNIGNQALSDEVIKLYENAPGDVVVTGRPEGLFGYSIEKLRKSRDPILTFEKWADSLIHLLKPIPKDIPFTPASRRVELLSFNAFKVRNDGLYQSVKNVFRKYVHSDTVFAKAYKKRFLMVASADAIVYSGAGEVGDNNIFLRQLLELRIAQKIGKKTYAINQSVEVIESPMKEICGLVYSKMSSLIVRGKISKENMTALGVSSDKIQCYPDSAFLNPTPDAAAIERMKDRYDIQKPAVGINATKVAGGVAAWGEIIQLLKSLGYSVYFISNDPFGDKVLGETLSREFNIHPILEFIDYTDYSALLANFQFVISCRLHTNELSLTGGTPIIPIEGSHFKTLEVFSLVEYPISVTNASSGDWVNQIKRHILVLHGNPSLVKEFIRNVGSIRNSSTHNLVVSS